MPDGYTYSDELVSDLYKDAYGFRPGEGFWDRWRKASPAQRQETWNGLVKTMQDSEERERQQQTRATVGFEDLVTQITGIVREFGRRDVVDCLHQAYDTQGDDEYLEHRLGLPFGYIRKHV